MTDYTKVNLSDVENSAERFGMADTLDARFLSGSLELEKTGMSYQRFAPNARMPFGHRQREQEEIYFVLSGAGRMKVDDEIFEVGTHDAVRVSPASVRAVEAGADGLELIAFGAPREAGTRPGTDAEPLPNWWSD